MTDYEDFKNILASLPEGDWADTSPRANTDRTQSSCELVERIKKLTEENEKLKKQLELAVNAFKKINSEPYPWYIAGTALEQIEELDK